MKLKHLKLTKDSFNFSNREADFCNKSENEFFLNETESNLFN